ncbi:MAG: Cysteine desulfurase [Planctomycetota bacterium]
MIDLDSNATTVLDPRVLEAMRPHLLSGGNPESRHALGRRARKAWEDARDAIAHRVGADPEELIFTSGGTEANNLALLGYLNQILEQKAAIRPLVYCSTIEHPAVSEPLENLAKLEKITINRLPVQSDGRVDPAQVAALLESSPTTPAMVSIMLANNETGVIQPIAELSELLKSKSIAFHTDAVQAVGRIDVNFHQLGVDFLASGSHKMHGPPGIGFLLVRKGVTIQPLLRGGGQQKALRPGTPPVALAVGLAEALRLYETEKQERHQRWQDFEETLRNILRDRLQELPVKIRSNSPEDTCQKLPQTVNLYFDHPSLIGELALMQLDMAGVAVSLGSACASGSTRPSPVLLAMGHSEDRARNSMRISFSAMTCEEEVRKAAELIASVVRGFVINES